MSGRERLLELLLTPNRRPHAHTPLYPRSSALRVKTAYESGGYEFCSHSGIGNCLLHASMTMQFPIPEYGVNSSRRVMEMHKKFLRCFNSLSYMLS